MNQQNMKQKNKNNYTLLFILGFCVTALGLIILFQLIFFASPKPGKPTTNTFIPTSITTPTTPGTSSELLDTVSLTAIPPRFGDNPILKAKPGEQLQFKLRVRNTSEVPLIVKTTATDFILDQTGRIPIPIDAEVNNRWSLASWLTMGPTQNTLPPKATADIAVTISVPSDALPGGHYAIVLHQPDIQATNFGSGSAITQRVGTLLYLVVEGTITKAAYIHNFHFPRFTEFGPVPFSFTVENASDIHLNPQTKIEIYSLFNKKLDTIELDSENIFPLSEKEFQGAWIRDWGWGLYKAKLIMSYGSSDSIVIASTSFWLFPLRLCLAILALVLGLLLLFATFKRYSQYKDTPSKESLNQNTALAEQPNSSNQPKTNV